MFLFGVLNLMISIVRDTRLFTKLVWLMTDVMPIDKSAFFIFLIGSAFLVNELYLTNTIYLLAFIRFRRFVKIGAQSLVAYNSTFLSYSLSL